MIPLAFLYMFFFKSILNLKAGIDNKYHQNTKDGQSIDLSGKLNNTSVEEANEEQHKNEEEDAKLNQSLNWSSFKVVMKFCGMTILNLAAVF